MGKATVQGGTVTSVSEVKAEQQSGEVLALLRKAAKAGDAAKAAALLPGLVASIGDPKTVTDETVKAEGDIAALKQMLGERQALLADVTPKAHAWLKAAVASRDAGVTSRAFGEATGTNQNTLGRLTRAADVFDAAKANGTPLTLGTAITLGNQRNASELTALVKAYGEADGTDPLADPNAPTEVKPKSVPTVEQYVRAVDALSERLSGLLSGDYATPKADTLEQMRRITEVLAKVTKQHETLIAQVAKAGKTPKARKSA